MIRRASPSDVRLELARARARRRAQSAGFGATLVSSIWGGSSSFNVATLSLTAFLRDYTGSAPWAGTASAGVSGDGSHNDVAGVAPAAGAALNGHGTASFNGTTTYLTLQGTLASYVNATAMSGWALVNLSANTAGYVFKDGSNAVQLFLQTGSVNLVLNSSATSVQRAVAMSTWTLITWRYDGVNMQVGVNEAPGAAGGASTAAFSSSVTPLTGTTYVVESAFYGLIADYALSNSVFSDTTFTSIKNSYINTRYGLSL